MPEITRRTFVTGAVTGALVLAREPVALASGLNSHTFTGALTSAPAGAEVETRGVGVYPGEPSQYVGPSLVPAGAETRNLALLRPAYHSSSYDYNLTAQLVTDGIRSSQPPGWISVSAQDRMLPKEEREILFNHYPVDSIAMVGASAEVIVHLGGGTAIPEIDRVELFLPLPQSTSVGALSFQISTSIDGHHWDVEGTTTTGEPISPDSYPPELVRGTHLYTPRFVFGKPRQARFYRVHMSAPGQQYMSWRLSQIAFYRGRQRVQIGGPYTFSSAWKSAGLDQEWVYVDLLAKCDIDLVRLHWIAAASRGVLQTSDDATTWVDVAPLSDANAIEEIPVHRSARYVRALLLQPTSDDGYVLSEFEVIGRGGLRVEPQVAPTSAQDGSLQISAGAWRLQRDSEVHATGEQLATPGFDTAAWLPATVPGTALVSYLNAGALPDPNFGRNQLYISDSFFYADFWYRTEFLAPPRKDELIWLCFDGVNWKAEVFLNGQRLGRVDGAFFRGRFDVTGKLKHSSANVLAVRIAKNEVPGSVHQKTYETPSKNGGALGADNPTFHASIGWDWIPTIRGRNTGLWNEVRLVQTGAATLEDPLVTTTLPAKDGSVAEVSVTVRVVNHTARRTKGTVTGKLGEIALSQVVDIGPMTETDVIFNPSNTPALRMQQPQLWWPTGYGEPTLHDAELRFKPERGSPSEPLRFKAGLRQMTFSEDDRRLRLFINGRRFIARGGNWGFAESMLRYRAREYDAALRYHREMNFNMVRNWVGQIGEDAFYEACDRYGIVVWQDFWLANPWDGPIPNDNAMFLANSRDLVHRIRRHASIGIYCGRNEGFPPPPLESGLRALLNELHPDIHYIGSSADDVVSGHGPYHTLTTEEYFRSSDSKLHSEIGAPNVPSYDSLQAMMPQADQWPQGLDYGLHDFTLQGAQGALSLLALIESAYGGASSAREWVELAQFLNYDTYRAMFEAQSRDRMGVLLWMSHPCWPSFVWQTYDFYLEPTAAYFGCRKACEAVHVQWNPLSEKVEVVNYNAGNLSGLSVTAELLNPDGTSVWKQTAALDAAEDTVHSVIDLQYPGTLAAIHFCRLTLTQGNRVLSANTYLRPSEGGNLRGVRHLGQATVSAITRRERRGNSWFLQTDIKNTAKVAALLTRLKVVGEKTGERLLPAIYEDNYFTLMPGEQRTLHTELRSADARGENPTITVHGFNVVQTG